MNIIRHFSILMVKKSIFLIKIGKFYLGNFPNKIGKIDEKYEIFKIFYSATSDFILCFIPESSLSVAASVAASVV